MALSPGARVGPYEIVAPLAAGGMGQVYRARDARLGRDVAIKFVIDALHDRPDLRERFKVEATAIAALNHPHICQVYDVGEHEGDDYLVMELVEGESLATRLGRGKLPPDQALTIAREIAGALDAAHRRGIVHRDVKPSNVMLTRTGAKLLDFGLARRRPQEVSASAGVSTVAPAPGPLTSTGMTLGTWQYMAPEQVRGEPTDSRTDVFALGALIYEVTTGRRAFAGATHQELVAAILETNPPPMRAVDSAIPATLDQIVRTCLAKAPDDRWQSAGEIGRALDTVDLSTNSPGTGPGPARRNPWASAAMVLIGALGAAAIAVISGWRPASSAVPSVIRSSVSVGDEALNRNDWIAFAPDGRSFVFVGGGVAFGLYRHDLATGKTERIAGTDRGEMPFLSPDGQWLGFKGPTHLMKVPIGGGRPVALAAVRYAQGASWGDDDNIVFGNEPESGLWRVPASGGTPEQVTTIATEDLGNDHRYPQVLPGSRGMLFAIGTGPEDSSRIVAFDFRSGAVTTLVNGSFSFRYVRTGHVAYTRDGVLYALPFDAGRLRVTGPAAPIATRVEDFDGPPTFDFSNMGDLVYTASTIPEPQLQPVLVDHLGNVTPLAIKPGAFVSPRFSPDGGQIAFHRSAAKNNAWVYDMARSTLTRVTYGRYHNPIWTPDGRLTLARGGPQNTGMVIRSADGTGSDDILTEGGGGDSPRSWTPDGRLLVFDRSGSGSGGDVMALSLPSRKVTPILNSPMDESLAALSPDGRWLSYVSNDDGRPQVYIQPLTGEGRRVQVSSEGGLGSVWSRDGRRLYYRGRRGSGQGPGLWVTSVTVAPRLAVTKPEFLFSLDGFSSSFDLSPDGSRFVMIQSDTRPPLRQYELVQNWFRQPATASR